MDMLLLLLQHQCFQLILVLVLFHLFQSQLFHLIILMFLNMYFQFSLFLFYWILFPFGWLMFITNLNFEVIFNLLLDHFAHEFVFSFHLSLPVKETFFFLLNFKLMFKILNLRCLTMNISQLPIVILGHNMIIKLHNLTQEPFSLPINPIIMGQFILRWLLRIQLLIILF